MIYLNLGMLNWLYIDKFLVKVFINIFVFKFLINLVIINYDIKFILYILICFVIKYI